MTEPSEGMVHPTGADISDGGLYRYRLWRFWFEPQEAEKAGLVNFIMLNPSTADGTTDDPTIRRCVGFAKAWGYDGIVVTNLYAWRATSPKDLVSQVKLACNIAIGPVNHRYLRGTALSSALVVCAWGNHGSRNGRGASVRRWFEHANIALHHLGLTKKNEPRHPLYLPGSLTPTHWSE